MILDAPFTPWVATKLAYLTIITSSSSTSRVRDIAWVKIHHIQLQ